jgi:Leishmanolysin
VTTGFHSTANPFLCLDVFDPPTCGGTPAANGHLLAHKRCPRGPYACNDTILGGAGSSAHLIMYMQYDPENSACSDTTVAYAAQCQADDIGRPSVGFMNWCSAAELPLTGQRFQAHVETGVHEVLHAMGFSGASWRAQRDDRSKSYLLNDDASDFLPIAGAIPPLTPSFPLLFGLCCFCSEFNPYGGLLMHPAYIASGSCSSAHRSACLPDVLRNLADNTHQLAVQTCSRRCPRAAAPATRPC